MHVGARDRADHVGGTDLAGRWLVETGRVAHRALHQMIEDRERDIDQQQTRDRFVDAAKLPKPAREHDPETSAQHAGAYHRELHHYRRCPLQHQRCTGGGQGANQERPFAADDDHAELGGQSGAQRRQDQRRRARQTVLPGKPGSERALVHEEIEIERVLAEQEHEQPEYAERGDQCRARDQDVFDRGAVALEKSGIGGGSYRDRIDGFRHVSCHEVAPSTPSTR